MLTDTGDTRRLTINIMVLPGSDAQAEAIRSTDDLSRLSAAFKAAMHDLVKDGCGKT